MDTWRVEESRDGAQEEKKKEEEEEEEEEVVRRAEHRTSDRSLSCKAAPCKYTVLRERYEIIFCAQRSSPAGRADSRGATIGSRRPRGSDKPR